MKEEKKTLEELADELAIRLGDKNRQTYNERLKLCRQSLTQIAEEVRREEREKNACVHIWGDLRSHPASISRQIQFCQKCKITREL